MMLFSAAATKDTMSDSLTVLMLILRSRNPAATVMNCSLILGTRDPSMTEEEFMKTVDERVKRLRG